MCLRFRPFHSLGISGWHTALRCIIISIRDSRCCAWSGEHPGLKWPLFPCTSAPPIPHLAILPYLLKTSFLLPAPAPQPTAPTQGNNTLSTCIWAPVPWRVHRGPSYFAPTRHKEPPKELESVSSDEENEDGDFTVYECPGLAPVSAPGA